MAPHILAVDVGTTSTKLALFDQGGVARVTFSRSYQTHYGPNGHAEQNPLDWWQALCDLVPEAFARANLASTEIECVAFSGKTLEVVPVDGAGNLVRARSLTYQDTRSTREASQFLREFGHRAFYSITGGGHTPAIYPLFKILWLKANEPEVFHQTDKFLPAKSFIIHKLTNRFATDYSEASQTGILDLARMDWSSDLLEAAGIPVGKLAPLHPSTAVVGGVTEDAARQTGLRQGTPVVNGGGDLLCACAGAGVNKPGSFYINLGSSGWWGTTTAAPMLHFESRLLCLVHIVPGLYAPHLTMYNGTNCEAWIRRLVFRHEAERLPATGELHDYVGTKAEEVPPGAGDLIFLPYLTGAGAPLYDPHMRAVFVGLSGQHDERHLYRSVLEGVAYQLRTIYDTLVSQGYDVREVRLVGGGAESHLWRQILADVLQLELLVPHNPRGASCVGAALTGAVAVGMFADIPSAQARFTRAQTRVIPRAASADTYDRLYDRFKKAYRALKTV